MRNNQPTEATKRTGPKQAEAAKGEPKRERRPGTTPKKTSREPRTVGRQQPTMGDGERSLLPSEGKMNYRLIGDSQTSTTASKMTKSPERCNCRRTKRQWRQEQRNVEPPVCDPNAKQSTNRSNQKDRAKASRGSQRRTEKREASGDHSKEDQQGTQDCWQTTTNNGRRRAKLASLGRQDELPTDWRQPNFDDGKQDDKKSREMQLSANETTMAPRAEER